MRTRSKLFVLVCVILVAAFAAGMALADDGQLFRRNISKTPDQETEKAALSMMAFYVPSQAADGTLGLPIEYFDAEGALVDTRYYAKPLISTYIDELEHEDPVSELIAYAVSGGVSFANYDAHAALSLDDGTTWKNYNLSRSADRSSFVLHDGTPYPGSVFQMVHSIAGDRVMAAWISRYCESGTPLYTLDETDLEALRTAYPDLPDMYLIDLFGVSGTQKSVDYTLQGFPEVGEIPYGCVWTARGKVVALDDSPDDGPYDILWTKAERLTSGRRDANRIEIDGIPGAGFVITWQEDPEGLRPGKGLGPGEGWSGAIVNSKTDVWYSYVGWQDFDQVFSPDSTEYAMVTTLDDYVLTASEDAGLPKAAVPMAMPVRLTDNNQCKSAAKYDSAGELLDPYCYADFDFVNQTFTLYAGTNPASDFCADSVSWTNPGGTTLNLCQTSDGRVLWGRTGAARARFNLQGFDSDGDGVNDNAWVILAYEELKALGDEIDPLTLEAIDIGKNIWYHTFDMFHPVVVEQGLMLNQPAKDPETGEFFDLIEPTEEWQDVLYETEISRRFNLMTQPPSKAGESGTVGVLIYKQGIINQGGPADIYLRTLVVPDLATFDPTVDNPYAYENIVCSDWEFQDGSNPNYVHGICLDPAINVSGNNILECDNGTSGVDCAAAFPWDGGDSEGDFPKVLRWEQTTDNLDDQSWENPYDVAKGHRGIIDGDFIMMMYAWAPNWKANTVGNDHYNLYIRRSFDGGATWTTTPASLGGDGINLEDRHCEYYGRNTEVEEVCTAYGPGEFEQAWNVSQLIGNKITVLDPRYTPTGGLKKVLLSPDLGVTSGDLPYEEDAVRDPSIFFVVYETGDNTTVAEGEAVPLDLYYSRATEYGDKYDWEEYLAASDGTMKYRWDWLENKADDLSGEASVTADLSGTFFYAVWNQWQEPEEHVIAESDDIFRRVMYLDTVDALPTSSVLYVSAYAIELEDELTLVGTARDNDHMGEGPGIVEYAWYIDDSSTPAFTGKDWKFRVTAMQPGFHSFGFSGKDNEGNWSKRSTVTIMVVEELHTVSLPLMNK